jgi:uncharacterized protein (DUF433 family)
MFVLESRLSEICVILAGMTNDELLEDYPDLEKEDIQACLMFATRLVHVKSIHKVLAAA